MPPRNVPTAVNDVIQRAHSMSFVSFVVQRYLRIRHERKLVPLSNVLAITGVSVGVMVLVVVIAVMSGFQFELKKRILGIEAHALVMRYNAWIADYEPVLAALRRVPEVESAAPFIYAQGMVRSAGGVTGVVLRGVDVRRTGVEIHTSGDQSLGELLAADASRPSRTAIVLGAVLAEKLKVGVGDGVMLMVMGPGQPGGPQLPKMHRFTVTGLFDTGMHQYDGSIGFVDMRQIQRLIGLPDEVTGIEVRVADPGRIVAVSQAIAAALGDDYWVNHWQQMHRNLFSMLSLQKIMMYIIFTLIILVAAFNVASALIMMVKEKTRDIAILKAMGASPAALHRIFLAKGIVIGITGILIGVGLGLAVCGLLSRYQFIDLPGDVYFLTTLPVRIGFFDIGAIIIGTLAICVFSSVYPARQAARLDAVQGIRYG